MARIVVVDSGDVGFIKVAERDLKDPATPVSRVADAVDAVLWHPDILAGAGDPPTVINFDIERDIEDVPELAAVVVGLQREAVARQHRDDLHCHGLVGDKLLELAPRTSLDEHLLTWIVRVGHISPRSRNVQCV